MIALTLSGILKIGGIIFWLGFAAFVSISVWHSFYTSESNDKDQ